MSAEPIQLTNSTPFDLIVEDLSDLLAEAKNWADGTPAETQAQVDEIARLKDSIAASAKALEAERVAEKKPLDDQVQAIQDRYNVYLAPLKNKTPGKVPTALDALDAAKRPFLLKLEAEQETARQKAREEAEAKARQAAEAARAAAPDDLEAREAAETKAKAAEQAQADARAAEKAKAHAHGGGRAQGLRTRVIAEITNLDEAVRHYWGENRAAFGGLVQQLANDDARQNRRVATGVTFREERY
jgi:predicted phage tail protein